jgi:hypothetical protein
MPGGKGPGPSIKHAKQYEGIKKKLLAEGMSEQEAKTRAAKISNSAFMNNLLRAKKRKR